MDVVCGPVTWLWVDGEEPLPVRHEFEPPDIWCLVALGRLPQIGGSLWRKSALVDVGGWSTKLRTKEENDLYYRLAVAGKKFELTSVGGAYYRRWKGETVSRTLKHEKLGNHLALIDSIEQHLIRYDGLTEERTAVLNQMRWPPVRSLYHTDRELALRVDQSIRASDPRFIPSGNSRSYCLAYRYAGLAFAGRGAALKDWLRRLGRASRGWRSSSEP